MELYLMSTSGSRSDFLPAWTSATAASTGRCNGDRGNRAERCLN